MLTVLLGGVYPAAVTRPGETLLAQTGRRVLRPERRPRRRLGADRPELPRPEVPPSAPFRGGQRRLRRDRLRRDQQGPDGCGPRKVGPSAVKEARKDRPGDPRPVPADLVTSSASGLDPHLSPDAAQWQAARIARARGMTEETGPRGHPPAHRAADVRRPGGAARQRAADEPGPRRDPVSSVGSSRAAGGHRRTSPDVFLRLIEKSRRGKLKIYIGHAAGVGKTYQMLEDALALKGAGGRHRRGSHRDARAGGDGRQDGRARGRSRAAGSRTRIGSSRRWISRRSSGGGPRSSL